MPAFLRSPAWLILPGLLAATVLGMLHPLPPWANAPLAAGLAALAPGLLWWRSRGRDQRYLQAALDALPQPIFLRDADSRFVAVNQAYAAHLGKPAAEIVGRRPCELVMDQDIARLMQDEDRTVAAGEQIHKETLSHHPVGAPPRHLVVSKLRAHAPDGRALIVGSYFDVSQWRQAEQALQAALAREVSRHERIHDYIQRLIDVIPQPVYIKDADSRYLLVNEAFCRERGRGKTELQGQLSYGLTADEALRARIRAEDAAVLDGETVLKEEHLPHMYTGAERFRLISKGSCLDAEGRPVIVGANFDITPWRQAERALQAALEREVEHRKRTQEYIQRLIDVIPHPVYVKDAQGNYVLVNEAFARDRQATREDLLGTNWLRDGRDSNFIRMVSQEDAEVLAGRRVLKEEQKAHPLTGKERYRVVAKGSCLDADNTPVIVCAVFDVTDWRLAEARWMAAKQAADRANEAKTHFLANMSHELRTPMHAILSFARLGETRTTETGDDKLKSYFGRIVFSGERLLGLLNDLLDLSKLEAGRVRLHLRPLKLRIAVQEALSEYSALLDTRQVSINLQCNGHDTIEADAGLIGQVLRNLLSNAIKFSPQQSVIDIGIAPDASGQRLELGVRDRGIGIPEEELEAVFDKFYQSSKTRSGAGGTGLGLAICKEIVLAHRGEIEARNRAGGGAEFLLRLPMLDTPAADEQA